MRSATMIDRVFDTKFMASVNGSLTGRKDGNAMDRRLRQVEAFVRGQDRARWNSKLMTEYTTALSEPRNDVVFQFWALLDDPKKTVMVSRSKLAKADYARSLKCGWPSHDQHLLAAAIDGIDPVVLTTEDAHGVCAAKVQRAFSIRVVTI